MGSSPSADHPDSHNNNPKYKNNKSLKRSRSFRQESIVVESHPSPPKAERSDLKKSKKVKSVRRIKHASEDLR